MRTIEQRARMLVCDQLGFSEHEVLHDTKFIEDLGADSLDVIELIMAAEEEFQIEIADEEAESLTTFGAALKFITGRVG